MKKVNQKKQYGFAYVTSKDLKEAKKIAKACLKKKLTACVNIFPAGVSCYKWKGEYQEQKETILLLKTRQDLFSALCSVVVAEHSYDCPAVVFIPFSAGHLPFFSYMDSQMSAFSGG